jgi:hypothetical protein
MTPSLQDTILALFRQLPPGWSLEVEHDNAPKAVYANVVPRLVITMRTWEGGRVHMNRREIDVDSLQYLAFSGVDEWVAAMRREMCSRLAADSHTEEPKP